MRLHPGRCRDVPSLWRCGEYHMTAGRIFVLGAAIGLAGSVGGLVLPASDALAQGAPYYRDASPSPYPPPTYRGGVPQEADEDGMPPGAPPPNYRGGPPGTYSSEELPPPSGDPRYGYRPAPPRGLYGAAPTDQDAGYPPPAGGPYMPPPSPYGARPYDPAPRSGSPDVRPPMGVG